ncbi:hypothetical protein Vqi01_25780 [Micromonospora qiuiae]|uniref:Uncharacterized protein n=1 Tax=Micromonospora qiuiae TaxID=502268 RepID=A0ABQ4JB61_9ACTN|nr:hypothetical protein [Micromonospora qiuiae]GIJ27416.1 hypothetical protein Vqi01_25780 [Micromonospora qiuiae]
MAAAVVSEVDGWPVGETPEDLTEYAMAQGAEGYDVHEVRLCRCAACGGHVFGVRGDLEEHAAKRICRSCGAEHFIADSGQYWDDARSGIMVCECDGDGDEEDFNVAVGYSLYADGDGIRAIAITSRCVACGRLGYWDDWMIRGGEMHLLDLA